MVFSLESMGPGNPLRHDVDPSAHSNEPLNCSVEVCTGLNPVQPRQLLTGLHSYTYPLKREISVHHLALYLSAMIHTLRCS